MAGEDLPMGRERRALVVEDETNIRELVCLHLGLEGYDCVAVGDGTEALRHATAQSFDLIVLDLMIPGVDGLTVCRAIRRDSINQAAPILMLTARRDESDKVLGLDSGADDYLTKPFGVRELVARVRALIRRSDLATVSRSSGKDAAPDDPTTESGMGRRVVVHGIEVDPARRRVRVSGREVDLTAQEFNLLYLLAAHPGIVFSREALLARAWKVETFVTARSVDTLIKRLRRKVEADPSSPRLLLTVWGAGYKFADV